MPRERPVERRDTYSISRHRSYTLSQIGVCQGCGRGVTRKTETRKWELEPFQLRSGTEREDDDDDEGGRKKGLVGLSPYIGLQNLSR